MKVEEALKIYIKELYRLKSERKQIEGIAKTNPQAVYGAINCFNQNLENYYYKQHITSPQLTNITDLLLIETMFRGLDTEKEMIKAINNTRVNVTLSKNDG